MKYLIFSDLHVNTKTFSFCKDILLYLHDKALEHDAEIAFLGDFWDTVYRHSTLNTSNLNEFISLFSSEKWKVKIKSLVGNHDMATADEKVHGLYPFEKACTLFETISEPFVDKENILWMPYRRDANDHRKVFSMLAKKPKLIFGHFDTINAKMGSTISKEGLTVDEYPCVTITGHYHCQQNINNKVHYVGSPYMVSQSEIGQVKRAILLDTDTLAMDDIILNFGPNRFAVESIDDLDNAVLKPKDVITLTLNTNEVIPAKAKRLQRTGVVVKIKRRAVLRPTRFENQNKFSNADLVKEYAKERNDKEVEEYLLHEIKNHEKSLNDNVFGNIQFKSMTAALGPFTKKFEINLNSQGLVLVTGTRNDDETLSNGSGKSMATSTCFLWILTGLCDSRSGGNSAEKTPAVSSVVNPVLNRAKGSISMIIGQNNVIVERAFTFNKKDTSKGNHRLKLFINGEDKSQATLNATQKFIAELLGVPTGGLAKRSAHSLHKWLLRTIVWTQQNPPQFLESSDTSIKQELSYLANIELWQTLEEQVRTSALALKQKFSNFNNQLAHAKMDLNTVAAQLVRMRSMNDEFETKRKRKVESLQSKLQNMKTFAELSKPELETCKEPVYNVNENIHLKSRQEELWTLKSKVANLQSVVQAVPQPITVPQVEHTDVAAAFAKVESARACVIKPNVICEACNRPFVSEIEKEQALAVFHNAKRKLRKYELLYEKEKEKEDRMKPLREQALLCNAALKAQEELQKLLPYMSTLRGRIQQDEDQAHYQRSKYASELKQYNDIKARNALLLQQYEQQKKLVEAQEDERKALAQQIEETAQEKSPYSSEINIGETRLSDLKLKVKQMTDGIEKIEKKLNFYKRCTNWCGKKGIQTYCLDSVIRKLESSMTRHCAKLFEEDFKIQFDFDDDGRFVRNITVSNVSSTLSMGQYRRVQLAAFLAYRDCASLRSRVTTNLLILDECTHSLDISGVAALNECLTDWCLEDETRSVFTITHEKSQFVNSSAYKNMLSIVRRGGSSVLSLKRKRH